MTATSRSLLPGRIVTQDTVEHIASCRCGYAEQIVVGKCDAAHVERTARRHGWQEVDGKGWLCPICALARNRKR